MDTLLDALRLHLLASIPQTFIISLFVYSFLRPQPKRLISRLVILSVAHSVYTDFFIMFLRIPVYLHLVNTLLAMFVLIFLLFKEVPLRNKLFVFAGGFVIVIIMDLITSSIAIAQGIEDIDSLRDEHLMNLISIMYPLLILTLIAAWVIRKRFTLNSLKFMTENYKEKKALLKVITLIIVQFVALGAMEPIKQSNDENKQLIMTILIYFTIVISLAALVFMLRMLTQTRADAIRSTQEVYFDDINNMFASVRGQRHDFLNHVQVIHAMAQMGKIAQLQAYTATLVQETSEVNDMMNHTVPALAAFAKAKTTMALGYGIAFTCDLPRNWNVPDTEINMLDMIKIIGNLVDNGFDATKMMPTGQRSVHVSIFYDNGEVKITTTNSGKPIDDEMRTHMFQAGYSTKGEGHSGLGLAIVQDRVRHYRGRIDVRSDSDTGTTTFEVRLPLSERMAI